MAGNVNLREVDASLSASDGFTRRVDLALRQQTLNTPIDAPPIHRFVHDPSSSSHNSVKNPWNEFSSSAAASTGLAIGAVVEENPGKSHLVTANDGHYPPPRLKGS
jgi:hypothetical protein